MALKDWGFAPGPGIDPTVDGPDGQPPRLRGMFDITPNTGLVDDANSIREFIDEIRTDPDIATPIGNAFIGTHADSEGNIFISTFPDQGQIPDMTLGVTNFEVLAATLDPTHPERSVKMDAIIDTSTTHAAVIKGCNIGKVPKFLSQLKTALAVNRVAAPMFFHGTQWDPDNGVWEYMAYEFKIFQKTPFTSRQDLINAFVAKNFTLIDGHTVVPTQSWQKWVPQKINAKRETAMRLPLGQTVAGRTELTVKREFRIHANRTHPFTWTMGTLSPFPAPSAYMSTLTNDLNQADEFKTTYGFPFYERWGYANIPDFIAGLRWSFSRGITNDPDALVATGTRSESTVLAPLTDPADGHLFFNFHPFDPKTVTPVIQMGDDDLTFFGSV